MIFKEFKNMINSIDSCEPIDGWTFDRIITLFGNVELDMDAVFEKEVGRTDDKISE